MNAVTVKQFVKTAFDYVRDLYENERIENLGLEEVEYDEADGVWAITVGFSRPWNAKGGLAVLTPEGASPIRSYKVVRIDRTGEVLSMKSKTA